MDAFRNYLQSPEYLKVDGWCTLEKALELIDLVETHKPKTCVELGVFGGLYFSDKGITHHSSSFELLPLYNPNTNELLALKVKFNGFEMSFLMGKLDHKNSFGLKRIQKMIFKKNFLSSEIIFNWRNHKAEKGVNYTYAGKYNGSAPGHDLPKI